MIDWYALTKKNCITRVSPAIALEIPKLYCSINYFCNLTQKQLNRGIFDGKKKSSEKRQFRLNRELQDSLNNVFRIFAPLINDTQRILSLLFVGGGQDRRVYGFAKCELQVHVEIKLCAHRESIRDTKKIRRNFRI